MSDKYKLLQQILDVSTNNKKIFGTSFCINYKEETWCVASGNLMPESHYFIASTTKLFVTSIVLNLHSQNLLHFDDKIEKYLEKEILTGLHTLNGKDHTGEITIKNLLAHTSGIPDYFQQKNRNGISLETELKKGNDRSWTFEQAIEMSKNLKPLFVPNKRGKAHYSDTNFQLLGKITETVSGKTFFDSLRVFVIEPLQLTNTYLYTETNDSRPSPLYFKNRQMNVPLAMASFGPDGGMVSTSKDMLVFIKAFFNGGLFPLTYVEQLKQWNSIFFPLQSGMGIHRFKLPWIFDPTRRIPELLGHSGLSGALAYCNPGYEIYIAGTTNQVAYPDASFRVMIKLLQKII